jgi:hypothetical protein
MNQEKTVYEILLLGDIKKSKARKLSKIIDSVYSQYERPSEEDIKRLMENIARNATQFERETVNGLPIAKVRQRISEILYQFFIGLATNGIYDAIKLLITYLSIFFMAKETEEMEKHMRAASDAFEKAFSLLPDKVGDEFLSETEAIEKFWDGYKLKLIESLRTDETLEPYFKDKDFSLVYIAGKFGSVIENVRAE